MRDDDYMTIFIEEHCDEDTIALMTEMIPYELIHRLLKENLRLCNLIIDTRKEVNALAQDDKNPVYSMTAENVFCGIDDEHPAMERYLALYEEHAVTRR
jgi:hypothetical protein